MKAIEFVRLSTMWNNYEVEDYCASEYNYDFIVGELVDGATYVLMTDAHLGKADALVVRKIDNKRLFAYLIEE